MKNAKNINSTINMDNFLFSLNFSFNISIKGIIEYVMTKDRINGNIVLVIILIDSPKYSYTLKNSNTDSSDSETTMSIFLIFVIFSSL